MLRILLRAAIILMCSALFADNHLLLQKPTLSRTYIVFSYAGALNGRRVDAYRVTPSG